MSVDVDRREFLQVGAGLVIGFTLSKSTDLEAQAAQETLVPAPYPGLYGPFPASSIPPTDDKPHAYIRIAPDESVTLINVRAEMGQGTMTACAQLLAEELDCDWSKVRGEAAPVNTPLYGYQGTVGSQSMRTMWMPLRKAAASGREMLIAAAAQQWGVAPSACRAENGFVIRTADGAKLSYGSLADAAAKLPVPKNVALKDPKQYRIIGKPMKRLDTADKISGRAVFGIDARVPGMVYAAVARCPVFGGSVATFDATKARAVPGVTNVVQIVTGVAVVADNTWAAIQGAKALEIQWNEGPGASLSSAGISSLFAERAKQGGAVARNDGDIQAGLARAAKKIDAVYEVPFLAHACMEPMNCTAHVRPDGCDVWAAIQSMTDGRDMTARMLNMPPDKINFHVMFMGGGFGRRGNHELDFVGEAVELSKRLGVPVKVTWSREDDIQHDFYRPAAYVQFAGGLDADGWPVAWSIRAACPAFPPGRPAPSFSGVGGLRDLRYEIPNFFVNYEPADTTVPVSFLRAPGHNQNGFFAESFLDEMAAAGGKDPVEVRRRLLKQTPRLLNVLNLAADKAAWGKPRAAGRFQGVALGFNVGSFNAQIAEVSVTKGKVKVHRVVCAFDCGQTINPAILTQQITGGIVYGLAAALKGEITIDRGRVQQANFNDYEVLRIDEMPEIDVIIVPSTENPTGAGEATVPGIAPAVTNAIFAATGKRLRKLPIRAANLA